ncbi:MAG: arginine--tRNA ligase [Flavobacteriaceae bacterium]|nr:arginine--tRNA ligase [Flavobacteriaceae bacterium]
MLEQELTKHISQAISTIFGAEVNGIKLESTSEDFEGDYTFVVFPYLKQSKKSPEQTAEAIGNYLMENCKLITCFNVVKGFLNLIISDSLYVDFLSQNFSNKTFGQNTHGKGHKVMVEYSSPNTNKPLHLGHVRNNLLGYSLAQIIKANGYEVTKVNLVNDRGIHICKSMLAWQLFGNGETPETNGIKGDKLVGKYYVEFDKAYKLEIEKLVAEGISEADAEKQAPLMKSAQEMLRHWEAGDAEVMRVWGMMNDWVYAGFAESYRRLGVDFDKYYYESKTYLLGKQYVQEGLAQGVFYQKDDSSVWIDLREYGLDEKIVQRSDGTSVYITQDIGTADMKYDDFGCEKSIYVVANEQDYHFKVLKLILQKMGKPYADGVFHFNYGMVDLPSGKMKSREGTVVDADDLMDEIIAEAKAKTAELGKTDGLEEVELQKLYNILGMGALKYYILKVDPQKRMLFNPAESIDLHGNTGPFIQYVYARIQSVLRASSLASTGEVPIAIMRSEATLQATEKELLVHLYNFPKTVDEAGKQFSPALVANYAYELARKFNRFYQECPILKAPEKEVMERRLAICHLTGNSIKIALDLLGINVPDRM